MRRRDLIIFVATAALLRSAIGRAQEPGRVYRLGIFTPAKRSDPVADWFSDELRRSGFVEGHNLQIDRHNSVPAEKAAEIAMALVATGVDAIATDGAPFTLAAQKATKTVPIVSIADDMVGSGLVKSLARPGGNTTGISILATELDGKRQELLSELVPAARRIAALANPGVTAPGKLQALHEAARARGIELTTYEVAKPEEIIPAIDAAHVAGARALNVLASPLLDASRQLIFERVAALGLPAIYQWPERAEEGGFAGYGPRFSAIIRQRARLLAEILRGAKPSELPVEQPDKFELAINLKTAKALGLAVPQLLLAQADEVIQ
jgi:putative tryptophan/tyrosine transport system substrate-binding protein